MKEIIGYLKKYLLSLHKKIFFIAAVFIAVFIFINYHYELNNHITKLKSIYRYVSWYGIFLSAFSFAYILLVVIKKSTVFNKLPFVVLLLIAPAIFAWKMAFTEHFIFSRHPAANAYWNHIIYWPFKLLVITLLLYIIWRLYEKENSFYGFRIQNFNAKPYFMMLLIMVPLIAAASTQPDFLLIYPKLKSIGPLPAQYNNGWYQLLYELSYGTDFFSIELFFRGFLVLAFARWVGKDAILPMALFYCTIHFGKPLGECISSFFGGMLLGAVTYNTRSIWGGLIVHLGIAWLMELGGYIGHLYGF